MKSSISAGIFSSCMALAAQWTVKILACPESVAVYLTLIAG
jgi:hypothetical protein